MSRSLTSTVHHRVSFYTIVEYLFVEMVPFIENGTFFIFQCFGTVGFEFFL